MYCDIHGLGMIVLHTTVTDIMAAHYNSVVVDIFVTSLLINMYLCDRIPITLMSLLNDVDINVERFIFSYDFVKQ